MLRFIIAGLYVVLCVIFCYPYQLYLAALAKKDQKKSWEKSWTLVRRVFKTILFIAGTKIEVRGAENIPEDKGCLFVGNHRSYFDILTLQTITPGPIGFIAKKEFSKVPLFYHYMEDIGCLFLNRESVKESLKTINDGTEYMKQGLSLGLFPEGTRNHKDELLPFKPGGYRMAEKSDSPIIVTAMTGLDDIFENNKPFGLKRKHVIIEFGKPVYPHALETAERKEYYNSIPEQISSMLKSHQNNA